MEQQVRPFYMWSILEAWNWLTHVPILGFVMLIVLGFLVVVYLRLIIEIGSGR
jgi:hypothetical protein